MIIYNSGLYGFTLDNHTSEMTKKVTGYIINNQYDKAIAALDSVIDTNDPLFPVLKLAAVGMRDVDYEKTIDSSLFLRLYDDAETSISAYVQKNGINSYGNMLSGMTKAIHATFYLRQKKYISAMQNGFTAIDLMKKTQNSDTLNYEVDFFLGLYEYARSELRSKLWWVLFWYPGDRERGMQRVRRCADNAIITGDAAKLSLCDIYLQNNKKEDARKLINRLKIKFPESRFVLWAEVKYFEAENNYLKAADIYATLSESYALNPAGEYNALVTITQKAQMLYKAGNILSARELCNSILQQKSIYTYNDVKKEVNKLLERCNVDTN